MIERMENRDYVDKEHIIELEGHNAKIFFLKHSDSNALKQVEELLIDAYENRVFISKTEYYANINTVRQKSDRILI